MAPAPAPDSPVPPAPGPTPAHGGRGPAGGSWKGALAFLALGVGLLAVGFLALRSRPAHAPGVATVGASAASAPVASGTAPAAAPGSANGTAPVPAPHTLTAPAGIGIAAPTPRDPVTARATVERGRLVGEPVALRLSAGQPARLELTADAPGELHLHGYDLTGRTLPGVPMRLDFPAVQTGRFPLEWHGPKGQHVELGVVEVYPTP